MNLLKKKSSRLLVLCLIFSGCASVHPGHPGESISEGGPKTPLKVSAQNVLSSRGDSFQLIEVTVENLSENWVKFNSAKIVISNPSETGMSVVLGRDLKDWAQAMRMREKLETQNHEMIQIAVLLAGAAVMASSRGNSNLATAGAATVVGSEAWILSDALSAGIRNAEGVDTVPGKSSVRAFLGTGKDVFAALGFDQQTRQDRS